jgi:hypothetical protein
MDMAEPNLAKLRTLPIEASPTKSRIDIDEAIFATPYTLKLDPNLA